MGQWLFREGTLARASNVTLLRGKDLNADPGGTSSHDPRKYNFVLQATVDGGGTWDVQGLGPAGTYTNIATGLASGAVQEINTGAWAALRVNYSGGTDGGSSLSFWASPKFNSQIP